MEKGVAKVLLMLLIASLAAWEGVDSRKTSAAWKGVDSRRSEAADEYELKRPSVMPSREPVKIIKTQEGDVIDCVHIYAQPAFDHPLLKDHVIKTRPRGIETKPRVGGRPHSHGADFKEDEQECPQGTIPILRLPKRHAFNHTSYPKTLTAPSNSQDYREFAVVRGNYVHGYGLFGVSGYLNVWNPPTEMNEYSASRIIVLSGTSDGQLYEDHILAGWIVFPSRFSDTQTRFYTHWQGNGAGCFDFDCPGFMQVSPKHILGKLLSVSTYQGDQAQLLVRIFKAQEDGNWWLQVEDTMIGYWPSSLFPYLSWWANNTEWGGEILNTWPGGSRSKTLMGSGHPWIEEYGRAAYISSMNYVNGDNHLKDPTFVTSFVTNADYNELGNYEDKDSMGHHIYFGGP
ncbi:uncharacterized protein LOC116245740 [Nymphaea colorata]|nr:uncharacterized protein LOC116245740 [Nymphaea colorata]